MDAVSGHRRPFVGTIQITEPSAVAKKSQEKIDDHDLHAISANQNRFAASQSTHKQSVFCV